jgi:hypothetical protein
MQENMQWRNVFAALLFDSTSGSRDLRGCWVAEKMKSERGLASQVAASD